VGFEWEGTWVVDDDELRPRILDAAAELFAEQGYGGTKLKMVAERAGVNPRTVKRLTGGRAQLFAEVMTAKAGSEAADRVAAAAADPEAAVALAVLLQAAAEIFAAPERSWNVLELEALTGAHRDDEVRAIESERIQKRWANMKTVTEQARRAGVMDDDVDDDAFVHFALSLSVGLAMVTPVVGRKPTQERWNALMARIGAGIAPPQFLLSNEHEARKPWRLRIDIPDRPGGLATLIRALSTLHVYVVATSVLATGDDTRTIDLAVTVPEEIDADTLLAAAMAAGTQGYVTTGSPDDRIDLPTRILDSATELVTNPGSAPLAAATLVEADRYEVTAAREGADDSDDVLRLQWTADRHVVLHRAWAPFARAEETRASALLRLATAIASAEGDAEAPGWVEALKGGETVWIRLARPEDADAISAMHERCSEQTLYRRYLQAGSEWRGINLRRLSGGHRGATLVAMSEDGAIVALGNLFPNEPVDDALAAEIAVIVEDAFQRRGIGSRMLRHMLQLADELGFKEVVGTVLAGNTEMLQLLEVSGLTWSRHLEEGVLAVRASLPSAAGPQSPKPAAGRVDS
jgi:AcrR family transcriptional regulator/RimJ/RimL family protein N-acetyltransferase